MADQEEDFSSLPLQDRFVHKNWKVRKEAYEAAAKEFDNAQSESDPVVRQFVQDSSLWKAAVTDANAAAHQEALNSLCSFLQIAGTQGSTRIRNVVVGPLVEKGLISAKPAAKQKATEAILLLIEMDKADPVIEEMIPCLSHKMPKVVAATLAAFTAIYHAYGCKTVDPKPVLKTLPKVFGHADKNVRAEAQNLTVEFYRWLRDGMKPMFWNDLKPVQQTDLEKLFENVKNEPPPKPERLLKSQQAAIAAAPATAAGGDEEVDGEEDDVDNNFEPEIMAVDVFAKIPKDFSERLGSSKWKDRKDALEELHTAVNVPAIEEGPFDEVVRGLAKSMKDANIAVVTEAAQCVELIARGLRRGFAKYRSTIMSPIIERLKERKQAVADALGAALDAVFASTSFADCLEEVLGALSHKNPQVKLETTKFLTRCLKNSREAPTVPETKLIADAATKLLTDSQEVQRNAGADVLGTLWKIMGDRVMNVHLDGLDDIRKAKIKEYYESAEVKARYKPKAAAPPAPKAAPVGKKPAPKKAVPGAVKKPAPVAAAPPPPAESPAPKPLQSKPTSRPGGLPKPGGVAAPAGRGLKPPSARVGGARAPPASPSRAAAASPVEDDPPTPAHKPASRGLAGRQLAKPSAAPAVEAAPVSAQQTTALTSVEKFELEELRIEVERLRTSNETIRNENAKLSSHVNELQDQNAQLIEDHTRDVLSIKAKETQLVRARSDAESAEQTSSQLQREVDRLKRELGRIGRASSPRATEYGAVDIFQDASITGGASRRQGVISPTIANFKEAAPSNSASRSPSRPNSTAPHTSSTFNRPSSRSAMAGAPPSNGYGNVASQPNSKPGTPGLPPVNGNPMNGERLSDGSTNTARSTSHGSASENLGGTGGQKEAGVESWKRAAEVTQNLKARIELMKAKQMQGQR